QSGFTLVEVIVVGILMTFLVAMLLPLAWDAVGQPSIDMMIDCRIGQEAQLTAMSLTADCGGYLPVKRESITGGKKEGVQFLHAEINNNNDNDDDDDKELVLSYSDGTRIVYAVVIDSESESESESKRRSLMRRRDVGAVVGVPVVVAANVYTMELDDEELDDRIKLTLTLSFRDPEDGRIPQKYRRLYKYVFYVPKGEE
ncbi:MAG: prepilin-type N-terminal cleavage/methylation domain-containing protein, partial [Pirellulaceae bacterium]|nr:prepilin-type N-terminal cleavage/methylation domain-containing protein [Pirellulaceae bacterium]